MNLQELLLQHAKFKSDWRRHLERFESGGFVLRTAGGADVTEEAVHFLRGQIMKLESIDRLINRAAPDQRQAS